MNFNKKREREPNWTYKEQEVLICEIEQNKIQILGQFSTIVTHQSRKETWEHILNKVNC